MSDQNDSTTDINWTPTALRFARSYYAGALLAAQHRPDDLHRQQRAEEAWNEYRKAAENAGQISAVPLSDFAHKQNKAY